MRVAIVGCCHGKLNMVYQRVTEANSKCSSKVELVLITGDFQAVRNESDLASMSVPKKYLSFGDFHLYYSGKLKAPVLTIFIGGNHEASNYMRELYYGGWVCPNIYYLGSAGVVNFRGLRIAGISGIYSHHDYHKGYCERTPLFSEREKKSINHYRDLDVERLCRLRGTVDIFLSHDWPRGIVNFGDKSSFLRKKPFIKDELERDVFGSPPLMSIMERLRPRFWFSSHMHCRFEAQCGPTFFLALDKCLGRREFLDITEISARSDSGSLKYDSEWLSILKQTGCLVSTTNAHHSPIEKLEDNPISHPQDISNMSLDLPIGDAVRLHYQDYTSSHGLVDYFNSNAV